jgi:hypothetical protein
MNIVQQFKYNNSNDYELIKRIRNMTKTLTQIYHTQDEHAYQYTIDVIQNRMRKVSSSMIDLC